MLSLFEDNRSYVLGDHELDIIGDRDKLAQWRHKGMGPAYYRLGRKIVYRGSDLNAWAEASRVDPCKGDWSNLTDLDQHDCQRGSTAARNRVKAS